MKHRVRELNLQVSSLKEFLYMCDGVEDLGCLIRERSTGGGKKSHGGMLECLFLMTWNLNLRSSCLSR